MKERPILFSGPMVRALLDGSKTQTRRVVKHQPPDDVAHITVAHYEPTVVDWRGEEEPGSVIFGAYSEDGSWGCKCPHGQPGDRLWVRETWAIECLGRIGTPEGYDCSYELEYRADGATREFDCPPGTDDSAYLRAYDRMRGDWWPSIHMPRWASRITLEVTGVRVERLQDISAEDARAEGIEFQEHRIAGTVCRSWKAYGSANGWYPEGKETAPIHSFQSLWDSLAAPGADWQANPWVWVVEFKRVS